MRSPCSRMIARKRSRAPASLRAGPCSVSTKPSSEASGVRSSWLALATKSTRIRSVTRCSLRSSKVSSTGRRTPSLPSAAIWMRKVRSTGTRSISSITWRPPCRETPSIASIRSGSRITSVSSRPFSSAGIRARIAGLSAWATPCASSSSAADPIASTSACVVAARGSTAPGMGNLDTDGTGGSGAGGRPFLMAGAAPVNSLRR